MDIQIQLAEKGWARDCLFCVRHSQLWDTYFQFNETAEHDIEEMIARDQIFVALNQDNECIGFIGVIDNGCFRKFSYLSLIAVEKKYRGKGIGRKLVEKFEEIGFKKADRVFLLVSDFNKKAQLFYEKLGYQKVGEVPDLFKSGVSEHILVKYEM